MYMGFFIRVLPTFMCVARGLVHVLPARRGEQLIGIAEPQTAKQLLLILRSPRVRRDPLQIPVYDRRLVQCYRPCVRVAVSVEPGLLVLRRLREPLEPTLQLEHVQHRAFHLAAEGGMQALRACVCA
jgi:hypothetical protein